MERIIKIISAISLFILLIIGMVFIINASNKKEDKEEYYTILENDSYIYKEGRTFFINVYSNTNKSLIEYKNLNKYYLILDGYEVILDIVDVIKYEGLTDSIYKIEAYLPETASILKSNNARLKIINESFTLNLKLGCLSIFNPTNYQLLSINRLYGSYSIINGEKRLVGLNIMIPNNFSFLTNLHLGEYAMGYLSKAKYNQNYDYEIDINEIIKGYNINHIEEDYILGIQNNNLFIPITYNTSYIMKNSYIRLELDGNNYYIDTFSFLVNELNKYDYLKSKELGELKYDKNR